MPRPSTATWGLPTHHEALIRDHGLDPATNPTVTCACGRRVLADVCVDIAALPTAIRAALGLADVEYLCDACCAVLHVHRYLTEEALCALLGAPEEHVTAARGRDLEHARGMRARRLWQRAAHDRVAHEPFVAALVTAQAARAVAPPTATGGAPVPHLAGRRQSHADSAAELRRAGVLAPLPAATPPP